MGPRLVRWTLLGLPFWLVAGAPLADASSPVPEFFGVYLRDGDKPIALHGGRGTSPPSLRTVSLFRQSGGSREEQVVEISSTGGLLVFDAAVDQVTKGLRLYKLPFVRQVVTKPDPMATLLTFTGPKPRPEARTVNQAPKPECSDGATCVARAGTALGSGDYRAAAFYWVKALDFGESVTLPACWKQGLAYRKGSLEVRPDGVSFRDPTGASVFSVAVDQLAAEGPRSRSQTYMGHLTIRNGPDKFTLLFIPQLCGHETQTTAEGATTLAEYLARTLNWLRPASLARLARLELKAKRYTEAEALLRQAQQLAPEDPRVLYMLGATLARQKQHDAAEAVFRELLALLPDFAPALNGLGYMNADRGVRLEEALTLIEKAVALKPDNASYLDSLGWALYRLNRLDRAEASLRQAAAKGVEYAVMFDHLADVLSRQGKLKEALEFWQKARLGKDEDDELDRAAVERKIRDTQAILDGGGKSGKS